MFEKMVSSPETGQKTGNWAYSNFRQAKIYKMQLEM